METNDESVWFFKILSNYEGGPCPPSMSGHGVLGFPRTPIFIRKTFGGAG
jgi:hypothetical protein